MKSSTRSGVRIFLLASIAAMTLSCQAHAPVMQCIVGDLTASLTPEAAKELLAMQGDWVRYARVCKMGDYLVDGPVEGASGVIVLSRNGRPFLFVDSETTTLFDADGKRILFQHTHGKNGDSISYSAYDAARGAWIDNVDSGRDGTMDLRATEVPGSPLKHEVRIGERWLEFTKRDSRGGVLLDGQFMSVADARARIEGR